MKETGQCKEKRGIMRSGGQAGEVWILARAVAIPSVVTDLQRIGPPEQRRATDVALEWGTVLTYTVAGPT